MKERKSFHIHMHAEPSFVARVDEWSFENRIRGRAGAIRALVEAGLTQTKKSAAETAISPRHEHAETVEGMGND